MEAFEGSKDVFRTMGEKAKSLGKVVLKEAKKVAGIHVGSVTEANPRYYIVIAAQGAMVREGIELDSATVHGLRPGDLVTVVDISGRRARIIDPVEGWVSLRSNSNEPIMELTIAPDKRTQVALMERRFEKLKASQQETEPDSQPPAAAVWTETSPSSASVATIKSKVSFKPLGQTVDAVPKLGAPGAVPKLSGPGLKRPPTVNIQDNSPQNDLLQLVSPQKSMAPTPVAIMPIGQTKSVDPFMDLLPPPSSTVVDIPTKLEMQSQVTQPTTSMQPGNSSNSKPGHDFNDWFN
jgi:hypothetical protein